MKFDLNLFKASPYRLRESLPNLMEKENFVTKKLLFTQIELMLQTRTHPNLIKTFTFGLATGYLLSNTKNYLLLLQLGPLMETWTKPVSKKDKNLFEEDLELSTWTKVCELTLNKSVLSVDKWKSIYEREKEVVTEFESVASLWGQVYIDAVLAENGIQFNEKSDFEKIAILAYKAGTIEFRRMSSILLPPVLHGQALKDLIAISSKNKTPSLFVKTAPLAEALNSVFFLLEDQNLDRYKTTDFYVSLLKKDKLLKITNKHYNYYIYRTCQDSQTCIEVHRLPLNHNFSQVRQHSCQKYNSLLFKAIDTHLVFLGGYSNEIWNLIDNLIKFTQK